jgi:type II secretory ATPase GspE/PulE/Tfp pilus assembly ATPase PilB-like protein
LCNDCRNQNSSGCGACGNTGFKGRSGLFQFLTINQDMRSAIQGNRPLDELRRLAHVTSLRDLALEKVKEGIKRRHNYLRGSDTDFPLNTHLDEV